MVSGLDKSQAQRNGVPRNSIALGIIRNKAKKIGSWIIIGQHPLMGLTLCSRQNSIVFLFSFGASACMRFIERVLFCVSGQKRSLMMMVINTSDIAYLPTFSGTMGATRLWMPFMARSISLEIGLQNPKSIT